MASVAEILSRAFSKLSMLVANEILMYPSAPNADPGTTATSASFRSSAVRSLSLSIPSIRFITSSTFANE